MLETILTIVGVVVLMAVLVFAWYLSKAITDD